MSKKNLIVRICLTAVSIAVIVFLSIMINSYSDSIAMYRAMIKAGSGINPTSSLNLCIRNMTYLIITLVLVIAFNAYIWFMHKIPSKNEIVSMKEASRQKKKERLEKKLQDMNK